MSDEKSWDNPLVVDDDTSGKGEKTQPSSSSSASQSDGVWPFP